MFVHESVMRNRGSQAGIGRNMNFLETYDPTSIGRLIIIALVILGALTVSHVVRPLEIFIRRIYQYYARWRNPDAQPVSSRGTPLTAELPHLQSATRTLNAQSLHMSDWPDFAAQWDRITDRLAGDIARVKQASHDHTQAATQLNAAEFSLSELFREYPGALNAFNPVTYLEFPALVSHGNGEGHGHPARKISQAASA